MASGHVYRANRPNTWLLRPILQREDSSCQPGAVHTWPVSAIPMRVSDVGFGRLSGLSRDRQTMPAYDPTRTSATRRIALSEMERDLRERQSAAPIRRMRRLEHAAL